MSESSSSSPLPGGESSPRQTEINQLLRRYKDDGITHTHSEADGSDIFAFAMKPSDPDFPHVFAEGVRLELVLPPQYPSQNLHLSIHNPDYEISSFAKKVISASCDNFCKAKRTAAKKRRRYAPRPPGATAATDLLMVRPLLKWLDKSLAELIDIGQELQLQERRRARPQRSLHDQMVNGDYSDSQTTPNGDNGEEKTPGDGSPSVGKDSSEKKDGDQWSESQQRALEEGLIRFPASLPPKERWTKIGGVVEGRTAKECLTRYKALKSALKASKSSAMASPTTSSSSSSSSSRVVDRAEARETGAMNTVGTIQCSGIDTDNVGFFSMPRLNVQIKCGRCKTLVDFHLTNGKVSSLACSKCSTPISAVYDSKLVHMSNSVLGTVDSTKSCVLYDVLPSDLVASCEECSKDVRFPRYLRGVKSQKNCEQCFKALHVSIENFQVSSSTQKGRELLPENAPKPKKERLLLKIGEALPKGGTCEHYRLSKRWFRFPCCGKAFPCDVCHDDASDHENQRASRMICGICSKEQAFSDACVHCQHEFGRTTTSHWEGGRGMRNKQRMNRNDRKKYTGEAKTTSKKQSKRQEQQQGGGKRRK